MANPYNMNQIIGNATAGVIRNITNQNTVSSKNSKAIGLK